MSNLKYHVYIPRHDQYFTVDFSLHMSDPNSLYNITTNLLDRGVDYFCFKESTPVCEYCFSSNRHALLPKYFPDKFINYLLLMGVLTKKELDYINQRIENIEG